MKLPSLGFLVKRLKTLITNPLVTNILIVGGLTLAIKLVAFYKETLVASTFGLSLLLDTFIIAVLIPSFIQNVFIGALNNIFIPNYITEQNTTKQTGEFQSLVFYIVGAVMVFFTLLTYLFIVLPALLFMGFSSVISGLLQIKDKFFETTILGIIPAASTIIALLFFQETLQEGVLAYGFLFGAILPFFFLVYLGFKHDVLILKKPKLNANSRLMFKQLPAKLTTGFLTGINPFVDQYFAGQLLVGSLAALSFGQKIPAFASAIFLIALGNVVLPYFSKLTNKDQLAAYRQLYRMLKILFLATSMSIAVIILFSENIVSIVFERGEFNAQNTEIVSLIQQILLIYIPFRVSGILMTKFLTSINKNGFMAYLSIVRLMLNIILNIILVKKYGLYGLAISTTLVSILITTSYFIYVKILYNKTLLQN